MTDTPAERVLILNSAAPDAAEKERELNDLLADNFRIVEQRDLSSGAVMFVLRSSAPASENRSATRSRPHGNSASAQTATVVEDRPLMARLRDGLVGKRLTRLGYVLASVIVIAVFKLIWVDLGLDRYREEIESTFFNRELLVLLAAAFVGISLHRRRRLFTQRDGEDVMTDMEDATPAGIASSPRLRSPGVLPWLTMMAAALFAGLLYAHWAESIGPGQDDNWFVNTVIALGLSLAQATAGGYGAAKAFRARRRTA